MKQGLNLSIGDLPEGSVIGTSSVRRRAQLISKFPHLKFAVAPCAALAFVRAVCSELRSLC